MAHTSLPAAADSWLLLSYITRIHADWPMEVGGGGLWVGGWGGGWLSGVVRELVSVESPASSRNADSQARSPVHITEVSVGAAV